MLKDLVTRQLLKSNQLGMPILFGIANEHNCFKIQFSVCVDKFEQYFDTFHLIGMNDLQNFVNNSKNVHPFEKKQTKNFPWFPGLRIWSMAKTRKAGNAVINGKLCQAKIAYC